jgi:tripartite-type tricarboxylate transporter receptor subunit TctC
MPRLTLLAFALSVCCAVAVVGAKADAAYPDKTVRFIVGFAPGGGTDTLSRLFAKKLSEKWHQPVIVENRPGANGSIAEEIVAHSPPDGYTIAWVTNAHTITPSQYKLNYDPIKDFAPITSVASTSDVLLVPAGSSIKSIQQLLAQAKSAPGKLTFGSDGTGTLTYLEMALLMQLTDTNMVHVPYNGGGPEMVALLGGEVELGWASLATSISEIQAGKLRALAVSTGKRSYIIPDVPTVGEATQLKGFDTSEWFGVLAPAGTPTEIINKIYADLMDALKQPDVQTFLRGRNYEPGGETPAQFSKIADDDIKHWADVLRGTKMN